MQTYMFTSELAIDDAVAVEKLIKGCYDTEACRWCSADLADFMLPHNYCITASDGIYCPTCGRATLDDLDTRCFDPLIEAWIDPKHPAHSAVSAFFALVLAVYKERIGEPDKNLGKISRVNLAMIERSGLPGAIKLSFGYGRSRQDAMIYDWEVMGPISRVINQAVLARLDHIPEFDYRSFSACPHCGASDDRHEWRNFDPVGRYADVYCGTCKKYIRSWDPN